MLIGGLDIGSGTTKSVLVDGEGTVRGRGLVRTKADFEKVAREALAAARPTRRPPRATSPTSRPPASAAMPSPSVTSRSRT